MLETMPQGRAFSLVDIMHYGIDSQPRDKFIGPIARCVVQCWGCIFP